MQPSRGIAEGPAAQGLPPSPIPTPRMVFGAKPLPAGAAVSPSFFQEAPMGRKLYVGNLTYEVTASELEALFGQHGTVESAQVIADRDTGRSKGFAFVEMKTDQEAQAAT